MSPSGGDGQPVRAGARHWIVALVLPCLLLAGAYAITAPREGEGRSADARRVEQELRDADPEIVLLGASTMADSVNHKALGQLLGEPPVRVAKLVKGSTMPPVWYVLAKERLYGQGVVPRVLVIGSTPRWLMETAVSTQDAKEVMAEHMTVYDPVVAEKAYGQRRRSEAGERIERARVAIRSGFQDRVREWSTGLVFGDGEGTLAEQGQRVAEPALAAVFDAEGSVDFALQKRVIPVVDVTDEEQARYERPSTVQGTFVPDLIALAQTQGSRVVFVWLPVSDRATRAQEISPATHAELVRTLNEQGVGWLDMHALGYGDENFRDLQHMNARGRERFTRDLAAALRDLDVLGDAPLRSAPLPFFVDHSVHREGTAAPLAVPELQPMRADPSRLGATLPAYADWSNRGTRVAGVGPVSPLRVVEDGELLARDAWGQQAPPPGTACHLSSLLMVLPRDQAHLADPAGHFALALTDELPVVSAGETGWWVYPGTSLVTEVQGAAVQGASVTASVVVEALGAGVAPPTAEIAGQDLALAPRGDLLAGEVSFPLPGEAWQIRLSSPADGPMVLVRWLALRSEGQQLDLMGKEALSQPPRVRLLAVGRQGKATVSATALPTALIGFAPNEGRTASMIEVPELEALSNLALVDLTKCPSCSPLRLVEDGVVLRQPWANCPAMLRQADRSGSFCQNGPRLFAVGSDGSLPGENGRLYEVALVADRASPTGFWLAPGDCSHLIIPGWQLLPMRHGARSLVLEGYVVGDDPAGEIELDIEIGDALAASRRVPMGALRDGPVELTFDPPIEPNGQAIDLRLGAEVGAPFVMLTRADLRE